MSEAPEKSRGPARPMFLERASYRRRRIVDAVRLLPVLGGLLWALPMLWRAGKTGSSSALLYVFGVWILLIALAAQLSRELRRSDWSDPDVEAAVADRDADTDAAPGPPGMQGPD